jgi:hypothetical protein
VAKFKYLETTLTHRIYIHEAKEELILGMLVANLLSQNVKIKTVYNITIFLAVSYGCES